MSSEEIYQRHGQELYFFILKKVKDKHQANDIFQNTFLKIHQNLGQLKADEKARAWCFQIGRNEIANYFSQESSYLDSVKFEHQEHFEGAEHICCFDKFIDDLPQIYKEVAELAFVKGEKQDEVAQALGISLANVKARVRRSKELLKERFQECCEYEVNREGKLVGGPACC